MAFFTSPQTTIARFFRIFRFPRESRLAQNSTNGAPTNLKAGEMCVDFDEEKVFFAKEDGALFEIGTGGGGGSGDALVANNLDQFANVTQTGTLAITGPASISGTNTGDQNLSGYVLTSAIDTFAELNSIITDTDLVATTDNRLAVTWPVRAIHIGGVIRLSNGVLPNIVLSPVYPNAGIGDLYTLGTIEHATSSIVVNLTSSVNSALADNPGWSYSYSSLEVVLLDVDSRVVGWGTTNSDGLFHPTNGTGGHIITVTINDFPVVNPASKNSWVLSNETGAFNSLESVVLNQPFAYKYISDPRLSDARTPTAHNHAASEITSGTMATARLGSGTADNTKFLRGDQTWVVIAGGGDALVANNLDQFADVTQTGTLAITGPATISGTNTGDQTNISGNAATVTTNANLTGHVTSIGNATSLGSFTIAQLNTAISDANLVTENSNISTSVWGYKAKTNAQSGYPGNGFILWNNTDQDASTNILISHLTDGDIDIELILSFILVGQNFFIQDKDESSNYQQWKISGTPTVTDSQTATAYYTFPVTLVASAGTGASNFANNHSLIVGLSTTSATSGGGYEYTQTTTINSTPTNLSGPPTLSGVSQATAFDVIVAGVTATNGSCAFFIRGLVHKEDVGSLLLIGTPTKETYRNAALVTADANITLTGDIVNIQVTGVAATTIKWTAVLKPHISVF